MEIWNTCIIESDKYYNYQVGPLKIWLQKRKNEWLIAWYRDIEDKESLLANAFKTLEDSSLEWHRWVLGKNTKTVILKPIMPDRAVVVKPESELRITPGADALFYVFIPIWIQIVVEDAILCELPTIILSNTWFGEPHDGELCYSLLTSARRSLDGITRRAHQAICPVYIKNTATEELEFKRLCIQVRHLGIFEGQQQMWTNKIHVQFRGDDKESSIKFEDTPQKIEKKLSMIGQPRKKATKSFVKKSFDTFKFLTEGV